MASLKKLEKMGFDKLFLVHSLGFEYEQVVCPAEPKIKAYLKYREEREKYFIDNLKVRFVPNRLETRTSLKRQPV